GAALGFPSPLAGEGPEGGRGGLSHRLLPRQLQVQPTVSGFPPPLRLVRRGRGWLRIKPAEIADLNRLSCPPPVLTSRSNWCTEAVDGERGNSLSSERLRHQQDFPAML